MIGRLAGAFCKLFDDGRRRWNIRIANTQVNEIHTASQSRPFAAIDLGE
jgi:hypothetical protein